MKGILSATFTVKNVLLLVILVITACKSAPPPSDELVIASYGGAWQEVQKETMFRPFASANSVNVRDLPYDGQYAKIKEMVNANHVEWDVVDVEGNMVVLGARDGMLEPIDYSVVNKSDLIPGSTNKFGVGIVAWSWVLAYRRGALSQDQLVNPWRTFFDVNAVHGARGLRNDPRRVLEIALIADGVPTSSLYPLDVDRAFRVLTRFRDAMRKANFPIVWWDEYSKPPQLLRDSEVVLTPGANGRIADAQKDGAQIDFTWNQGIVDLDWWVIPRGSHKKDLAMRFIAFASSPDPQAAAVKRIPYGPVNQKALSNLPEDVASKLPTYPGNLQKESLFNTEWWADNADRILARWNEWRASTQK